MEGFEIYARPEAGRRGEDFDFTSKKGNRIINVEVTALTAPNFSKNTIVQTAEEARPSAKERTSGSLLCIAGIMDGV